jgi:hypothetical protein
MIFSAVSQQRRGCEPAGGFALRPDGLKRGRVRDAAQLITYVVASVLFSGVVIVSTQLVQEKLKFPQGAAFGTAAPAVPAYQEPARPEIKLEDLSEGEQCALIQMSGRTSIRTVWMKLREQYSVPPFTLSTFVRLRDLGLAEKPEGHKFHRLTWNGAQMADLAARTIVKTRDLHAPWLGGDDGKFTSLHCVCGWSCGLIRNPRLQLSAARAFSNHLAHVERKAKARAEEIKTALAPICQGIEEA